MDRLVGALVDGAAELADGACFRGGRGLGDGARAGASGGVGRAGQRERDGDPHLDQRVPAVEPALRDLAAHRGGDLAGPAAGGCGAVHRVPGSGERCQVGGCFGPVPCGDGGTDVQAQ